MSVTRTYTVTVVSTGSGNKYAIDGVQQKTLNLIEGKTYEFDQSDSSNSSHPLRFSTTSNGTHSGGDEYTTGVTTNGTPGSSGAYTRITVASSAPTLYYYCTNHSNMGGLANTLSSSVTRAYDVTVAATDSGNKYVIDGVQQDTLYLAESGTYYFDQSDSTNGNHPFRFSTTSNGTHSGGSEYTTGVTTSGTPGQAGAYTQIVVATDAPTLYYYCTQHSGMGGTANTPAADTWGALNWNANLWGTNAEFTVGWGAKAWNDGEWDQLSDETITLTGVSATLSVGEVTAFPEQGWGRDTWNFESWGESGITFELTAPDAITSFVSGQGWSVQSWGENQGWGMVVLSPANVMGLSGVSSTSNVGSPTIIGSAEFSLTGIASTSSVGSLSPADVMGLTGQVTTSAVGSILPADVIGISGVSATSASGSITINSSPIIVPSGQGMTASVGSLDPSAIIMGLSGVSFTSAVGSITPADAMGLSGVSFTASVAAFGTASGFGIQAYSDVDTGSNSSYTNVASGSNTSYTDAA